MADVLSPYNVWKGTASEYKGLHKRVTKRFGRVQACEVCPRVSGTRFDWANVSGRYDEFDRNDWKRLCRFCHMRFDAANYEGKRFAGKQHSPESRSRIAESMRLYWEKNRAKMMAAQPRGPDSARYKHGGYSKF